MSELQNITNEHIYAVVQKKGSQNK